MKVFFAVVAILFSIVFSFGKEPEIIVTKGKDKWWRFHFNTVIRCSTGTWGSDGIYYVTEVRINCEGAGHESCNIAAFDNGTPLENITAPESVLINSLMLYAENKISLSINSGSNSENITIQKGNGDPTLYIYTVTWNVNLNEESEIVITRTEL